MIFMLLLIFSVYSSQISLFILCIYTLYLYSVFILCIYTLYLYSVFILCIYTLYLYSSFILFIYTCGYTFERYLWLILNYIHKFILIVRLCVCGHVRIRTGTCFYIISFIITIFFACLIFFFLFLSIMLVISLQLLLFFLFLLVWQFRIFLSRNYFR